MRAENRGRLTGQTTRKLTRSLVLTFFDWALALEDWGGGTTNFPHFPFPLPISLPFSISHPPSTVPLPPLFPSFLYLPHSLPTSFSSPLLL